MSQDIVTKDVAEAMGVSDVAYDEVVSLLGRFPLVEDLSTLLAMWDSNGRQQGLLSWLKGQPHAARFDDYLFSHELPHQQAYREPRIRECLALAQQVADTAAVTPHTPFATTGQSLFMVGDVSGQILDSEYARKCLHLVDEAVNPAVDQEACDYIEMILQSLLEAQKLHSVSAVGQGGLFQSLLSHGMPAGLGFDILCAKEIRLDAFLFGEAKGRYLVSLAEADDDFFLQKMDEARLNCCFLGRTTAGRIVVDGYDFGSIRKWKRSSTMDDMNL